MPDALSMNRTSSAPGSAGRKRVLVADDEASMRLLLRVNLPLSGYDVVEAADGETALAVAREEHVDLILLDVMLPGISGFDVAEHLRKDSATAHIPIVFVSARADEADVRHGLELGALGYITKPFDPLSLGRRLDELTDARAQDGS